MKRKRLASSITQDEIDEKITKLLDTEDIYLEDAEFGGTLGKSDFGWLHVKICGNIIDELIKKGIPASSIKKMIEERRLTTRGKYTADPDDWQYKRLHKLLEPKLKEEIKLTNAKKRSSLYELLRKYKLTDMGRSISEKLDEETLKGLIKKSKSKRRKRKKSKSKRKKRKKRKQTNKRKKK